MLNSALKHKTACTCREIFRYRESTYLSGNALVTKSEWVHMKSLSRFCDECKKNTRVCRYTPIDEAHEVGADVVEIECTEHPRKGALYRATYHAERDWETGSVDGGHWSMAPFTPDTNKG